MSPSLQEAGDALCAAGCRRIEVLPMFLGSGGHLRQDLPPLLQRLRERHPTVRWTLHEAVGEQALVREAMAAVALTLLADDTTAPGPVA